MIDYYTVNNSTVNICSLDLTKAFDCVNHHALFAKLMDRNIPKCFILVLYSWYSKLYSNVRWGNSLSRLFQLTAGVRQGGILSPALFSIFVNEILLKLERVNKGCYLNYLCVNSITYADDLMRLVISVSELQYLVDICVSEFRAIGMQINISKSACIRIRDRHNVDAHSIVIDGHPLLWKRDIRYLGLSVAAGKTFTVNWQNAKQKLLEL